LTAWLDDCLPAPPVTLEGVLLRLVESQEQIATTELVDNLLEQSLLEEMLETSKPPTPHGGKPHYLLSTPFRYPPLRHGSRFGRRHEPSLLYGASETITVLAESAYYRLLFLDGMQNPPTSGRLITQHTLFGASYATQYGARLNRPPCDRHRKQLRHPADYNASQQVGSALRERGILAFSYRSARDPRQGENIALFQPEALTAHVPLFQQAWQCETTPDGAGFSGEEGYLAFSREIFLYKGRLPSPAV